QAHRTRDPRRRGEQQRDVEDDGPRLGRARRSTMTTPNGVLAGAPAIAERRQPRGTVWPTLRAIYIIWYRDILRFWRDRTRVVASFAQPLLYLAIFGTGLSSALQGAG